MINLYIYIYYIIYKYKIYHACTIPIFWNIIKNTNTFFSLFKFSFSYNEYLVIGKRKFDGLGQSQGDPKRRFGIGNGGNWGSQPLPQQPLGNGAEQWYTDTYPTWS